MSDSAFEHCFPARNEAVIDPDIGSEQRALGSFAKVLDRAELDFHLPGLRHGCIGAVEWAIGPARRRSSRKRQPLQPTRRLLRRASWGRPEHPNRRRFTRTRPHRYKEPAELGDEQRGPGSR